MTCSTLRSMVYDYLDGELPPAQRAAFESRAAQCPECRERLVTERVLLERVRSSMRRPVPPHWLAARVSAALAAQATDPRAMGRLAGTGRH